MSETSVFMKVTFYPSEMYTDDHTNDYGELLGIGTMSTCRQAAEIRRTKNPQLCKNLFVVPLCLLSKRLKA